MTLSTDEWHNSVLTGDCLEWLYDFPESSIHSCITSPPYWQLRDYDAENQLGLEDDLDEYVANLVEVGRAIRHVLHPDGSWWLNLGDKYEDKQKLNIPYEVARELKQDGWIERNDVTWYKPNAAPQSVKDRLNCTTETLFHFTPERQYWYHLDAIREPHAEQSIERSQYEFNSAGGGTSHVPTEHREDVTVDKENSLHPKGKNPGDLFKIPTAQFPDAHFAVFPKELPTKPIKATCPPKVCAECGAPYTPVTEQIPMWQRDPETINRPQTKRALEIAEEEGLSDAHFEAARSVGIGNLDGGEGNPYDSVDDETATLAKEAADVLGSYYREALMSEPNPTGEWKKPCECETAETTPGIVLDPFAGAGTTLLRAKELERKFVGIELNPEYADMARRRVGIEVEDPSRFRDDDISGLEEYI